MLALVPAVGHREPLAEAQPLPFQPGSILYLPAVNNKRQSTFAAVWGFLWVHGTAQGLVVVVFFFFGWLGECHFTHQVAERHGQRDPWRGCRLLGPGTRAGQCGCVQPWEELGSWKSCLWVSRGCDEAPHGLLFPRLWGLGW